MTDMREMFVVVFVGILALVGSYVYLAVSHKYRASFINFCLVTMGGLCGTFLYWAIWLGGLTGSEISVMHLINLISDIIWKPKSDKAVTVGEFAWNVCWAIFIGPTVLIFICNTGFLKFLGKKKVISDVNTFKEKI